MAKLKAPTEIGGIPIDPRGASAGEGLVFDGAAFSPQPIDPGSGALFLPLAGGIMAGDIDMDGHEIQNVVLPDYVSDGELAATVAGYLPLAGGVITGGAIQLVNSFDDTGGYVYAHDADGRRLLMLDAGPPGALNEARIQIYHSADSSGSQIAINSPDGIVALFSGLQIKADFGTIDAPAFAFRQDADSGFIRSAADQIGVVTAGIKRFDISTTYLTGIATGAPALKSAASSLAAPAYAFSGDIDTGVDRAGADQLRLVCGGSSAMLLTATTTGFVTGTTGTAANLQATSSGSNVNRFTSALKYKMKLHDADWLADIELKPQKFYRRDDKKWFYGFIADWLADQDPILGQYGEDGEIENYDAPGVMAILAAKVNRLTDRIKELEGSLNS